MDGDYDGFHHAVSRRGPHHEYGQESRYAGHANRSALGQTSPISSYEFEQARDSLTNRLVQEYANALDLEPGIKGYLYPSEYEEREAFLSNYRTTFVLHHGGEIAQLFAQIDGTEIPSQSQFDYELDLQAQLRQLEVELGYQEY